MSDGKNQLQGVIHQFVFKNNWFVAVTENLVENYDMLVYTSKDLINWKRVNVKLNGNEAICSRKKPGAKEQEVQINYGLQNSLLRVMSFMLLLVFT